MALSIVRNAALAAVSAVIAPDRINLEDELQYFGGSRAQALKAAAVSGVVSRRVAAEGVCASDLCRRAAERLFVEGGQTRDDVDLILFVSQSPDYPLPATASILQDALGLSQGCAALDMNSGCSGFVHGLWVLFSMVSSGLCRKALLLVGDTQARFLNPENRVTAPLFGDGGCAALVTRKEGETASFLLGNGGGGAEALTIPGGGSRLPPRADEGPEAPYNAVIRDPDGNPWTLGGYGQLWMEGMRVFAFGAGVVPGHLKRHLALANLPPSSVDRLMLHQANKLMLETIAKKLGLPPTKTPTSVLERYGNLGAASLAVLLCEELSGMKDRGPLDHCLLCGFGAGLSWSSCLVSLSETLCLPVTDYRAEAPSLTREQRIAYWHEKFARN